MIWIDLMRSSFRASGVLRPGQQPNNSEITDSLFVLNSMLESFSLESLIIYEVRRTEYTLTGASSYTIGPGGDFDQPRPLRIERAGYIYNTLESPTSVISNQRWAMGGGPTNPGGFTGVYYDKAFPVATIHLRPVPTTASHLALYAWQPLTQIVSESETVELPPGYADAVRYNLAVRIAAEWGRQPRPDVLQLAIESKAIVKSFNSSPPPEMDATDGGALGCGCGGSYNIYSDGY